jgi:hypothetical protein
MNSAVGPLGSTAASGWASSSALRSSCRLAISAGERPTRSASALSRPERDPVLARPRLGGAAAYLQNLAGDLDLAVDRAELEVGLRHLARQTPLHRGARPFGRKQLAARGGGARRKLAPQVEVVRRVEGGAVPVQRPVAARGDRRHRDFGKLRALAAVVHVEGGRLRGVHHVERGLRFADARHGLLQVGVARQRFLDQALEHRVAEQRPPAVDRQVGAHGGAAARGEVGDRGQRRRGLQRRLGRTGGERQGAGDREEPLIHG